MVTALIFFIVSAVGLVVLLWHKVFEIKKGAPMLSLGIRERGDMMIQQKIVDRKNALVAGSKSAARNFVKTSKQVSHAAVYSTLHSAHGSLTKTLEKMKGKKSPKNVAGAGGQKAPASFFLQNLSEKPSESGMAAGSEAQPEADTAGQK